MKKIQMILCASMCMSVQTVIGQTRLSMTKDSSVTIDAYAGVLAWNATRVDSFGNTPTATVRFGALGNWQMSKMLALNAFSSYEVGTAPKPVLATEASLRFTPTKEWLVAAGNIAMPATEQRPLPPSAKGQFETWTMAQIPGLAPGVKVEYMPNNLATFALGAAVRSGSNEYQASVGIRPLTVAVYYQADQKTFGSVATLQLNHFYSLVVYQQDKLISNTSVFVFGKDVRVYSDFGYDLQSKSVPRSEQGILKGFTAKLASGLIGCGYDAKLKAIKSYLFVHI